MNKITNDIQISRKITQKSFYRIPCDWFIEYYSFNLPLALKPIVSVPNAHTIRVTNTLPLCKA